VSGENLIILAQNVAIVYLLWKYNKDIGKFEKIILSAAFLIYALVLLSDKFLNDKHWSMIAKSNIILCKELSSNDKSFSDSIKASVNID
jgi:hypothetical protein